MTTDDTEATEWPRPEFAWVVQCLALQGNHPRGIGEAAPRMRYMFTDEASASASAARARTHAIGHSRDSGHPVAVTLEAWAPFAHYKYGAEEVQGVPGFLLGLLVPPASIEYRHPRSEDPRGWYLSCALHEIPREVVSEEHARAVWATHNNLHHQGHPVAKLIKVV